MFDAGKAAEADTAQWVSDICHRRERSGGDPASNGEVSRTGLLYAARLVAGNRPEIPARVPTIPTRQAVFSAILYGVPPGVARSC